MKLEYLADKSAPDIGAVPLNPKSTADVLQHVIDGCDGMRVIFDLDSTLLDNRPRNARIMQEFGEIKNQPLLTNARPEHFMDWSAKNAMSAIGLEHDGLEQLLDAYAKFWEERFFTSEYCQYDTAVSGAPKFVNAIVQAGGLVSYLTGRHDAMRSGSIASLVNLGFPDPAKDCLPAGVELITKPTFSESDDDYKQAAILQLKAHHTVHAAFDNEPAHINSYKAAFPAAMCVHLLTDHSMRSIRLMEGIVSILNFEMHDECVPYA